MREQPARDGAGEKEAVWKKGEASKPNGLRLNLITGPARGWFHVSK